MLRKLVSVFLILAVMMTNLMGCSLDLVRGVVRELEDNADGIKSELHEWETGIRREIDDWLSAASKYALTKDKNLKGERNFGVDDYVGTYGAKYSRFSGEEYIFGGTSAGREYGNTLKVTYSLHIQSGTAVLYWLGSPDDHILSGEKEEHVITEVTAEETYEFMLSVGDNFIVLKGDDFTGALALKAE